MKSIITQATELIETVGEENAIKFFEEKIITLGKPKNFDEICKLSGYETAIQFIKGEL